VSFILVVDRDPAAGQEIADLLGGVGFDARTETSGEDALAVAGERRPQAVLLEVRLPGVSGYEVLRELRRRYGETLPIMFVSAERVESFDRVAGLLLGADDYVVKPFAPDELIARVRRLVFARTRMIRELSERSSHVGNKRWCNCWHPGSRSSRSQISS
jgi:DNA-binding response OmpR family regulator